MDEPELGVQSPACEEPQWFHDGEQRKQGLWDAEQELNEVPV